ncbi:MAG TPA: hypothetical protein VKA27_11645 [Sunxiuqinia sp.]|nr:hypothetical protein [Sunxiuqinia sp.]
MKNSIFTVLAVLLITLLSSATKAADTDRMFKEYDITQVASQDLKAGADKAWVLSYNSNQTPITITLHESKRAKYYVVRGDNFEVAYECCKKGFGASYVKSAYSEVPYELTNSVINREEMNRQKVLTTSQLSDEKAVNLIAAYLPDLVNPSYKHLLN